MTMRTFAAFAVSCLLSVFLSAQSATAAPFQDPGDFASFSFNGEWTPLGANSLVLTSSSTILSGTEEFEALAGSTPSLDPYGFGFPRLDASVGASNNGEEFVVAYDRNGIFDPASPAGSQVGSLTFSITDTIFAVLLTSGDTVNVQILGTLSIVDSDNFYDPVTASFRLAGTYSTSKSAGFYTFEVVTPSAQTEVVPLPASLPLLLGGLIGMSALTRRRKSS